MHYYLKKICNICIMFEPFEVPIMLNKRKVASKCLLVRYLLFLTLKNVMWICWTYTTKFATYVICLYDDWWDNKYGYHGSYAKVCLPFTNLITKKHTNLLWYLPPPITIKHFQSRRCFAIKTRLWKYKVLNTTITLQIVMVRCSLVG